MLRFFMLPVLAVLFLSVMTLVASCSKETRADMNATESHPPAHQPDRVYERTWVVTHMDGQRLTEHPNPPQLHIAADGQVTGSSGCNRIMGTATVAVKKISIGRVAMTRRACLDDMIMATEQRFAEILNVVSDWTIENASAFPENDTLFLMDKEQNRLLQLNALKTTSNG